MSVNVDVAITKASAITANGNTQLLYEVLVTNFESKPVHLSCLEVLNGTTLAPLASYRDAHLQGIINNLNITDDTQADPREIAPGVCTIVYVWLELSHQQAAPVAFQHRLVFSDKTSGEGRASDIEFIGATTPVPNDKPIVIGPPLRDGPWLVHGGFDNAAVNRRKVFTHNGSVCFPRRFSVAFLRFVDRELYNHDFDRLDLNNHHSFGQPVLAVADGVISAARDGIPDSKPFNGITTPPDDAKSGGNYIFLDIGKGHYASYAHLQQGSIEVKEGDRVSRGQVIAKVGHSANRNMPHLQFGVGSSGSGFTDGEGLGFVFDKYLYYGGSANEEITDPETGIIPEGKLPDSPESKYKELPLEWNIVGFG
mgnify:FL=1